MIVDIPDGLMVIIEILCIVPPLVLIMLHTKFPDWFPIFLTIVKRGSFILVEQEDGDIHVVPARYEEGVWKGFSGVGKSKTLLYKFESKVKEHRSLFGRSCIMVNEGSTAAVDSDINEMIVYLKNEMGLKIRFEFENAVKKFNHLIEILKSIENDGGYWKVDANGVNTFVNTYITNDGVTHILTAESFFNSFDHQTKEFMEKYRAVYDGGLILNGLRVIRTHDVEGYVKRLSPFKFAGSEIYIKRKAQAAGSADLKKFIIILLLITGATLLLVLLMSQNGGQGAATAGAGVTGFLPKPIP